MPKDIPLEDWIPISAGYTHALHTALRVLLGRLDADEATSLRDEMIASITQDESMPVERRGQALKAVLDLFPTLPEPRP